MIMISGVFNVIIGQGHRPSFLMNSFSFWSTATNNANDNGPIVEMFSQIDGSNANPNPMVALMGSSAIQGGTQGNTYICSRNAKQR